MEYKMGDFITIAHQFTTVVMATYCSFVLLEGRSRISQLDTIPIAA